MKYALLKIPPAPFTRGSKTVFLRASDVFGQNIAYETDVLPLEKGE